MRGLGSVHGNGGGRAVVRMHLHPPLHNNFKELTKGKLTDETACFVTGREDGLSSLVI